MHETTAFKVYLGISASGKKIGPFHECQKNLISRKRTFQAYLREPFLAT
jgi:hypothetical protein